MVRWRPSLLVTVLFLAMLTAAPAWSSDTDEPYSAMLKMLEAGLSEEVVWAWLEGAEQELARPTADQIIELRRVGASEDFLKRLLAVSGESTATATATSPVPLDQEPPTEATASSAGDGTVMVRFQLSYATSYDEGTRAWDTDEPWELYVYLDGIPLTYVPKDRTSLVDSFLAKGSGLEFQQELPTGKHVLRVAQEKHVKKRGQRWSHTARLPERAFEFELEPGSNAQIGLRFEEGWLGISGGGPLTFKVVQGSRVQEAESVGGDPEEWPSLCDESESNATPQQTSADCVRWQDLWAPLKAPSRTSVRDALAEFEYRPVPKGS